MNKVIPLPTFLPKQKVIVIDANSKYANMLGVVISTATTAEMAAVSVKFNDKTYWFYSSQLAKSLT
jgi:hypothetical protein